MAGTHGAMNGDRGELRRPGRPPLDDADRLSVPVTVRLPSRQYDELWRRAHRERISVPELIRKFIPSR
jgi:hypothetical protein